MKKEWKRKLVGMQTNSKGEKIGFCKEIRKQLCEPDKPRFTMEYDVKPGRN